MKISFLVLVALCLVADGKKLRKKVVEELDLQPCSVILASQIGECDAANNPDRDCVFNILSEATCQWSCDCVEKTVSVDTVVVEGTDVVVESNPERIKKKIKKEGRRKKRRPVDNDRSGTKLFNWSNCYLSLRGWVKWGDDANEV